MARGVLFASFILGAYEWITKGFDAGLWTFLAFFSAGLLMKIVGWAIHGLLNDIFR